MIAHSPASAKTETIDLVTGKPLDPAFVQQVFGRLLALSPSRHEDSNLYQLPVRAVILMKRD